MSIHVLVLNYNRKDLLEECLPSIIKAVKASPVPCRLTVVDNASTDGSTDWVRKACPEAGVIETGENDFLFSFNPILATEKDEAVLLLNNDIKVERDFIQPLWMALEENPDSFCVSPVHYSFDGEYNGGRNRFGLRGAIPWAGPFWQGVDPLIDSRGNTLFTGNGLFRTRMARELGGFDRLFFPMGWEDVDICMRAWKRGWISIYEPTSVIYHKSNASIGRDFAPYRRKMLSSRNAFIWWFANITSPRLRMRFWLGLLPTLLACMLTGRFFHVEGFLRGLARYWWAVSRRRSDRKREVWTDEFVMKECGKSDGG